jgi:hypothetical protein
MEKQTYIIGPVVPVSTKKDRKRAAEVLAKQLMRLLAEDYDVIEIVGYKYDGTEDDLRD